MSFCRQFQKPPLPEAVRPSPEVSCPFPQHVSGPRWRTHGLPPRSRDRDRRHAAERGRRDRRCRNRYDLPRRLAGRPGATRCPSSPLPAGHRGSRGARGTVKNAGGLGRRTRLTGGRVRRLARPAAPPPPPPARPLAQAALASGTDAGKRGQQVRGGWSVIADAPSAPSRSLSRRPAITNATQGRRADRRSDEPDWCIVSYVD